MEELLRFHRNHQEQSLPKQHLPVLWSQWITECNMHEVIGSHRCSRRTFSTFTTGVGVIWLRRCIAKRLWVPYAYTKRFHIAAVSAENQICWQFGVKLVGSLEQCWRDHQWLLPAIYKCAILVSLKGCLLVSLKGCLPERLPSCIAERLPFTNVPFTNVPFLYIWNPWIWSWTNYGLERFWASIGTLRPRHFHHTSASLRSWSLRMAHCAWNEWH